MTTYSVPLPNIYQTLAIYIGFSLMFCNAALRKGFSPYVLYPSDALAVQPGSTFFALIMYATATYGIYHSVVRYLIVRESENRMHKKLSIINTCSLIGGLLQVIGMMIAAFFAIDKESTFWAHIFGAFLTLGAFPCFGLGQIWINSTTKQQWKDTGANKLQKLSMLMFFVSLLATVAFGYFSFDVYFKDILQQQWIGKEFNEVRANTEIPVFGIKINVFKLMTISSLSEWIAVFSSVGFYMTQCAEFSKAKLFFDVRVKVSSNRVDCINSGKNMQNQTAKEKDT